MRSLEKESAYKRDIKREMVGRYRTVLLEEFPSVLSMLANDIPLPLKYRDHILTGDWAGHRECHIKPDLLLIYMKIEPENAEDKNGELRLARLGSHSELF